MTQYLAWELVYPHPAAVCVAVQGAAGQLAIVKQALPYVRAVGEAFRLSRVRGWLLQ
jgi:hypothetical protein